MVIFDVCTNTKSKKYLYSCVHNKGGGISPKFFLTGALAGSIASAIMTPMDVIKTRVATNTIPPNLGLVKNIEWVIQEHGVQGLYAGVRYVSIIFIIIGLSYNYDRILTNL